MKNLFYHSVHTEKKRITIAGILDEDSIRIGISQCSESDNYIRKKGNLIAKGRAESRPIEVFRVQKNENPVEIFVKKAKEIVTKVKNSEAPIKKLRDPDDPKKEILVYNHGHVLKNKNSI